MEQGDESQREVRVLCDAAPARSAAVSREAWSGIINIGPIEGVPVMVARNALSQSESSAGARGAHRHRDAGDGRHRARAPRLGTQAKRLDRVTFQNRLD